jgi:hypothetical protein
LKLVVDPVATNSFSNSLSVNIFKLYPDKEESEVSNTKLFPLITSICGLTKVFIPIVPLEFLIISTLAEVPIPTLRFGWTVRLTESPLDNPCAVDTAITEVILLTFPVNCP